MLELVSSPIRELPPAINEKAMAIRVIGNSEYAPGDDHTLNDSIDMINMLAIFDFEKWQNLFHLTRWAATIPPAKANQPKRNVGLTIRYKIASMLSRRYCHGGLDPRAKASAGNNR